MIKQMTLTAAAIAMTATALVPAASAATVATAERAGSGYAHIYTGGDEDGANLWQNRNRNRQYYGRSYNDRRYAYNRQRAREKCNDGDGGTVVGAIAGGLVGNQVAGRGNRTVGTLIGGALGALAGREIDRSDRPDYCRR